MAGLVGVEIPATTNQVQISPVTNADVADSPIYRDSFLVGSTVNLDPRLSGVRTDGLSWTGSPLIDATAYYQLVGVSAAELMTKGGNVSIGNNAFNVDSTTQLASGASSSSVIVKSGAVIDYSGGWITYQGGTVRQTELIAADGAVVPIGDANPNDQYVGVYNGFTVDHFTLGRCRRLCQPDSFGFCLFRADLQRRTRRWVADINVGRDCGRRHPLRRSVSWIGADRGRGARNGDEFNCE